MREPLPAHKRAEILVKVAGQLGRRHDEVAQTICDEAGKPTEGRARRGVARDVDVHVRRGRGAQARRRDGADGRRRRPARESSRSRCAPARDRRRDLAVQLPVQPRRAQARARARRRLRRRAEARVADAALRAAARRADARRPGCPPAGSTSSSGSSSEIGDVLVEDERVAALTFTGSGDVGWKLTRARAAQARQPRARQRDARHRLRGRDVDDAAAEARGERILVRGPELHLRAARSTSPAPAWDRFVAEFVPKVEALEDRRSRRTRRPTSAR